VNLDHGPRPMPRAGLFDDAPVVCERCGNDWPCKGLTT
jgi:hypothetical protein